MPKRLAAKAHAAATAALLGVPDASQRHNQQTTAASTTSVAAAASRSSSGYSASPSRPDQHARRRHRPHREEAAAAAAAAAQCQSLALAAQLPSCSAPNVCTAACSGGCLLGGAGAHCDTACAWPDVAWTRPRSGSACGTSDTSSNCSSCRGVAERCGCGQLQGDWDMLPATLTHGPARSCGGSGGADTVRACMACGPPRTSTAAHLLAAVDARSAPSAASPCAGTPSDTGAAHAAVLLQPQQVAVSCSWVPVFVAAYPAWAGAQLPLQAAAMFVTPAHPGARTATPPPMQAPPSAALPPPKLGTGVFIPKV